MCGIAGIFPHKQSSTPAEPLLTDMIHVIRHRGPDAQHTWTQVGIGLAHARLSIIDLHAHADQPMHDPDTGCTIVFNGEIYNYIEIKNTLTTRGHHFHTHSDTEVILKAYAEWGVECLNHFNGMWAFGLYDPRNNTLFCARDRLGIKPFIYGIDPEHGLLFASEAKALTTTCAQFRTPNTAFLTQFVERDFFACYTETFYQGLYNLLPGHFFTIQHGEIPKPERYWKWIPKLNPEPICDDEAVEHFRALLTSSIRLRFRSDVPVGACLSGGMDSSTIVGLAKECFQKPIHTFSCIYPHQPAFDESFYIQASVNKFSTIPKFIEPSHDNYIQSIHDSIYEQDGPTGGPSVLSQRAVMELASQDVKVVLDGQGADELLGGYHSYFRYSLMTHLRHFRNTKSIGALMRYFSHARDIRKRVGKSHEYWLHHWHLTRNPAQFYTAGRETTQLAYFDPIPDDDLHTLLMEHVFTNLSNLLHYEDRNSMRFSIESRLPFLDYRLVEYAFSLPSHFKIRGSTTKWILNQVAKTVLPPAVLHRKDKMGFSTPAHQWFLIPENMRYFATFFDKKNDIFDSLSQGFQAYLTRAFSELKQQSSPNGSGDLNSLWRFFTANMWLEKMVDFK